MHIKDYNFACKVNEIDEFIVDMGGQYSINDLENRVVLVFELTILLLQ